MKIKLGPNSPRTLASMHSLAETYAALDRHADALKLGQETLGCGEPRSAPTTRRRWRA